MSRDVDPEDQAVRDLLLPLNRVAYAIERLVQLHPSSPSRYSRCERCDCSIVETDSCPVCGAAVK